MRLVTADFAGRRFVGAWIEHDTAVLDLRNAASLLGKDKADVFASMESLIAAGQVVWDGARALVDAAPPEAIVPTTSCKILAPLPEPPQIRDFLCFEEHLLNSRRATLRMAAKAASDPEARLAELEKAGPVPIAPVWYERPVYYNANRFGVSGPDEEILWPAYSNFMDYELEIGAVIGKGGKDIPAAEARSHIFGYTIFNDWSARDLQMRVMEARLGPGKGKDFDSGNGLGPCIVTADEISDPYALTMVARVNGVEWSRGSSGGMYHKFEDCIAEASRDQTIRPAEIFGSGTVGSGCGWEHGKSLADGDLVELEVEGIGILRNRVVCRKPIA